MSSNRRFVSPNPNGGWDVQDPSASRASSHHNRQAEAQAAGRRYLGNIGGGELITQGRDGKIRAKDTVAPGNDPYPPKGVVRQDPLDLIDTRRFDADGICERLNQFNQLPPAEQDAEELWSYSGLDEAGHPFTALLGESHNTTVVVRDIEGPLMMLWESGPLDGPSWSVGLLYRDHMPAEDDVRDALATGEACEFDLQAALLVITSLPAAPGPVRTY